MLLRQFFRHTSNHTIGHVLMMVAGLVSLLILTRLPGVGEYGLTSLVATALSLRVGVGKPGMQHSTLRFHSEIAAGTRRADPEAFLSTSVPGMALLGGVAALLWAVASQWVPEAWWNDPRVRPLMLLTSVLILVLPMAMGMALGRKILPAAVPWGAAAKFGAIAAVMYFSVTQIELGHESTTMLARTAVGLIIYAALGVAFDREVRQGLDFVRGALGLRTA